MKFIKKYFLFFIVSHFLLCSIYSMQRGPGYYDIAFGQKDLIHIRALIRSGDIEKLKKCCVQHELNHDNSITKLINTPDFLQKLCCKSIQAESLESVVQCLSYLVKEYKLNLHAENILKRNVFYFVVLHNKKYWALVLSSFYGKGKTPLLWAVHFGKGDLSYFLLENSVNFREKDNKIVLHDPRGWNLFHVLFMSGNTQQQSKISFLEKIFKFFEEKKFEGQVQQMFNEKDFKRQVPLFYTGKSKALFENIFREFFDKKSL